MATFLLFLCIASGCAVIGILAMLYAPTLQGMRRMRVAGSAPIGFVFMPPPPSNVIMTPTTQFTPPETFAASAFVPTPHVSTDFLAEEPVREYRRPTAPPPRAKTPPPLPKAAQAVALPTAPRLGVSAPARSRHLEPPRRMPPPMPRTRSARGSDAPPPTPKFSTENMRTLPHERDEFPLAEHTFVD